MDFFNSKSAQVVAWQATQLPSSIVASQFGHIQSAAEAGDNIEPVILLLNSILVCRPRVRSGRIEASSIGANFTRGGTGRHWLGTVEDRACIGTKKLPDVRQGSLLRSKANFQNIAPLGVKPSDPVTSGVLLPTPINVALCMIAESTTTVSNQVKVRGRSLGSYVAMRRAKSSQGFTLRGRTSDRGNFKTITAFTSATTICQVDP